jgi:hypothetical protein
MFGQLPWAPDEAPPDGAVDELPDEELPDELLEPLDPLDPLVCAFAIAAPPPMSAPVSATATRPCFNTRVMRCSPPLRVRDAARIQTMVA